MKMFNCPSCGKPISTKAVACPKCGHAVSAEDIFEAERRAERSARSEKRAKWAVVIGTVIAFIWVYGGNSNSSAKAVQHQAVGANKIVASPTAVSDVPDVNKAPAKAPNKPKAAAKPVLKITDAQIDTANKYSDDYGPILREATRKAVSGKVCKLSDIAEEGGWTRSTQFKNTWFTYCGGLTESNRVYFTPGKDFWNNLCTDRKVTVEYGGKPLTFNAPLCEQRSKAS